MVPIAVARFSIKVSQEDKEKRRALIEWPSKRANLDGLQDHLDILPSGWARGNHD